MKITLVEPYLENVKKKKITSLNLHVKLLLLVNLGRLAFFVFIIVISTVYLFVHACLVSTCADQWRMVLFRSAVVHVVRWEAPLPGRAPRPHLTVPTSVRAPPSQVTLIFASDLCPVTGRSSQEVRYLKCIKTE